MAQMMLRDDIRCQYFGVIIGLSSRAVRGIFFRGGNKVIFSGFFPDVKCFFPVESSHFSRLKTNFSDF